VVKWASTAFAVVFAYLFAAACSGVAHAQQDTFVSPNEGSAGTRFQVVGETGWTPGETLSISFGFSDAPPGENFAGPFYNEQPVTVLRDGTWSFPVVINRGLVPFPLWRPGYIVVKAEGATQTTITPVVYTVEGRRPVGEPPLSELGFGPVPSEATPWAQATASLLIAGAGAMLVGVGAAAASRGRA
jgi:hypothetical protein